MSFEKTSAGLRLTGRPACRTGLLVRRCAEEDDIPSTRQGLRVVRAIRRKARDNVRAAGGADGQSRLGKSPRNLFENLSRGNTMCFDLFARRSRPVLPRQRTAENPFYQEEPQAHPRPLGQPA